DKLIPGEHESDVRQFVGAHIWKVRLSIISHKLTSSPLQQLFFTSSVPLQLLPRLFHVELVQS
ncbi:hypothetical protein JMJ77_0007393, partial [Colletotrichum scovillei]